MEQAQEEQVQEVQVEALEVDKLAQQLLLIFITEQFQVRFQVEMEAKLTHI